MRYLYFTDRKTWDRVVDQEWKAKVGSNFMHDQSLLEAVLGGADPTNPTSWHAAARYNWGQFGTVAGCQAAMKKLPPFMQCHMEYLPSYVFNSNPWTFYTRAFKYHAIGLGCDGPAQQEEYKLQTLLGAIAGSFTNPCW
jgi:hypothetical protein